MTLAQLFKRIVPYVKPHRFLLLATLSLTLLGSLLAQVNAVVLDRTVDAINALVGSPDFTWAKAVKILTIVSIVLLGKEILRAGISFGQSIFGEKLRINISQRLSLGVVERILQYRMAFFARSDNAPGMLQARIDQGASSISRTIQNFFINLLPMIVSSVLALILIFAANVYVGLTALAIVPIYFWITSLQGKKLKSSRKNMRGFNERRSGSIMNILESMNVVKSFNREEIELGKQTELQEGYYGNQLGIRRASFGFDALKSFVSQTGTVLIIILTSYLVLSGYPGMTIGKIMYHIMLFSNVTAPITSLQRMAGAEALESLYEFETPAANLLADAAVLPELNAAETLGSSDTVADMTDLQTMLLAENMSAFGSSSAVSDGVQFADIAADTSALDVLLAGSGIAAR